MTIKAYLTRSKGYIICIQISNLVRMLQNLKHRKSKTICAVYVIERVKKILTTYQN